MRSLLLVSILAAATAGACSQSLTPNMSGTGGIRAAGGGATGTAGNPGTTGVGGIGATTSCSELATEYQTALSLAGNCTVGAYGQCQQLVTSSLYPCAGCETYANDSSALFALTNAWYQAGCQGVVPPCGARMCPPALNNTCVSIDGGSAGYCEYLPTTGTGAAGASGGFGGAGGMAGSSDGGAGSGPLAALLYPDPYMAGDYLLALSNVPLTCNDTMPTPPCSQTGITYVMGIQFVPGDLVVGVHSLRDLSGASYSELGPNLDLASCWSGFGGGVEGSLDILSVTNTTVLFQLQGTFTGDFDVNDVSLTAVRCPGATGSVSTP